MGYPVEGHEDDMATAFIRERPGVNAMFVSMLGPGPSLEEVTDISIPSGDESIPARVYRHSTKSSLPIMVYFHGGGWVFGSVATHDTVCRTYAAFLEAVIVSVDYRLAPEHPFPAAFDDCYAATVWVSEHAGELGGVPSTLSVGGDSAGGNLAGAIALKARDEQAQGAPKIRFQLLTCPVTDYHTPGTPSYTECAETSIPPREMMVELFKAYMPDEADSGNPFVCPLKAEDLSGLPPALVLTATNDVLRDEGEAYAARLQSAGVEVTCRRFTGGHVGMCNPANSQPNHKLALALMKAVWQHALEIAAVDSAAKL